MNDIANQIEPNTQRRSLVCLCWYGFVVFLATAMVFGWQYHLSALIDRDGVTYLQAAMAYQMQGLHAATALGAQAAWPFYSIVIAWCAKLTGLPILFSAYLVDYLLISISAFCFIAIVNRMAGHRKLTYLALLIFLSWHEYTKAFPAFLRDHGFITFLLLSVILFHSFLRSRKWRYALLWSLSLLMAFLFRLEAIIYILLMPLSLFSKTLMPHHRIIGLVKLYVLPLLAFLGLIYYHFVLQVSHELRLDYVFEQLLQVFSHIIQHWQYQVLVVKQTLFPAAGYPGWGLFGAVIFVFLGLLIDVLGPLATICLLYLLIYRRTFRLPPMAGVISYATIALLVVGLFFLEYFFASGRYFFALAVMLHLLVPVIVNHAYQALKTIRQAQASTYSCKAKSWVLRLWLGLFLVALFYQVVASVHQFGHHHLAVEKVAGEWIKQHVSPSKSLFTNAKRVMYYAGLENGFTWRETRQGGKVIKYLKTHQDWHCYDYLVVLDGAPEVDLIEKMFYPNPIQKTVNKVQSASGRHVVGIFKLTNTCAHTLHRHDDDSQR